MPASNPSPPGPASATVAGIVNLIAQTFAGVKTFLGTIIASAGVQLGLLFNTNGTGASDRSIVVGTNVPDGSVNSSARLFTVATGVGGTEVDHLRVTKGGTFIWSNGTLIATISSGAGIQSSLSSYFAFYSSNGGYSCGNTLRLTTELTDGAASVGGLSNTVSAWSNATSRLWSFRTANVEKSAIMSNGEFEHAVAGAGIVLRSPDNTRWRLTVSNAGALVIAAA